MGGKFDFAVRDASHLDKAKYHKAIKEVLRIQAPEEVYVSAGQQDMGVSLIIKVKHKAAWTLLLPTDPLRDDIECSFTYGIVSRRHVWEFVRSALSTLCRALPGAFTFRYEDNDLDEVNEVGYYDYNLDRFVVQHRGLPSQYSTLDRRMAAFATPSLRTHSCH